MNKDKDKNGKPTEEQQPSDETQPEYREISKDELKQILENHKKWLESGGKEGKQADLRKANLQNADLRNANLQKASLRGANLINADFCNANMQMANLIGAKLRCADLSNANMKKAVLKNVSGIARANLHYANLQGAIGLLGNEFAQADVTGTKPPDDIKEFKALETVKETSQNARKIFLAMLLGSVYSWLTIATTTDVRLLTNTASSPLPIIGTEIPIAWFYIAAPLVLICLYFYFHLYLDNLWGALASLPAIFPDGKRLDERAYPWLLNTLVRKHFKRLKSRPLIARMKEWITIFLAWWVVPITMIAFWLRYIPRHDWWGTCFHIALIVVSVAYAIIFYRLCALTLQGKEKKVFQLVNFWRDRRFYYGIGVFLVGVLFSLLSHGAIEGVRPTYLYTGGERKVNFYSIKEIIPWAFKKVGYDVFVDFREKAVSEKPDRYWEIAENDLPKYVKGANLNNRNLTNADMYKAFLVNAHLRHAIVDGAYLKEANLQQAILTGANLRQANLKEANLQKANFVKANLQQAILTGANLQQANLKEANLQKATLWRVSLQEAKLEMAHLHRADLAQANLHKASLINTNLQQTVLHGANLQKANFVKANLQQANLKSANLKEATLGYANLQQANLSKANLQQANLLDANLQQANLTLANIQEAKLGGANLQEANFIGAVHLTIEQLSKAKTLYQAKLDPELMEQVKKCCPHLLEKPKEDTDKTK